MESKTKRIWKVTYVNEGNVREVTQLVAANKLKEVLLYFNEKGIDTIVKIEKTPDEITYPANHPEQKIV